MADAFYSGVNNCSKTSERMQNGQERVDVQALSPKSRRQRIITIVLGATTQAATTVNATAVPIPDACTLVSGYQDYRTAAVCAGGTSTISVKNIAANGSTKVVLTGPDTCLGLTADIPSALTIATTNVALAAGTSLEVATVTSNNVVGTAQVGGVVTLIFEPVESATIVD